MILAAFSFLLLLAPAFGGYVFPDDFQLCNTNDKNLDGCVLSALRDALPKLAKEGISSPISLRTEPVYSKYCEYHIRNVDLLYDEYFFNLSHVGLINSTVVSANADAVNWALNFTTFSPFMVQIASYFANGSLLYNGTRDRNPIWGHGISTKKLYNVTILHQLKSKQVEKDGEIYLEVESYKTSIQMDLITLDYGNLYNGTNPELAKDTKDYLNEIAMYLVSDIGGLIEIFFGDMFKTYANLVIGSVPLNKLVPDFQ